MTPIPSRRPRISRHASQALALAVTAALAPGQGQEPERLSPPTEALVFKSGQAYVYRDVAIEPGAESTRLRLPTALHGTVWLGSKDVALRGATAREAVVTRTEPVTDLAGVLLRAKGRTVLVSVQTGTTIERVTGVVERTIDGVAAQWYGGVSPPPTPTLVVLGQGDRQVTLPISSIVGVQSSDADLAAADWTYARPEQVPVLDVRHDALAAGAAGRLGLGAMTGGLAWTPSYVLELADERDGQRGATARLVGKAVVVNDSEALVDTHVRLVIGYPNLQFGQIQSSLLPEVTLDAFRQALQSGGNGQRRADVMSQIMSNIGSPSVAPGGAAPLAPVAGERAEDLFLYDVGRLSLEKGERAYVPLVDATIPLAHRFDWDLADQVDNARFVQRKQDDGDEEAIWHVVLLDNTTDAPWTTAPILIQGTRGPLAQSTLRYTPAGAKEARVKLTKALDLVGESVEFRANDTGATPRDERFLFGNRYETVEVRGRLELTNHSDRAAPVRIRKRFSGDLVSAEHQPEVRAEAKRLGDVNVERTAVWTFDLAAGETWTAEYRYRVLIHR